MKKKTINRGIVILAFVACGTVVWLGYHRIPDSTFPLSGNIKNATGQSKQIKIEEQIMSGDTSVCCCGDLGKPKPNTSHIEVVSAKATKKVEPIYPEEAKAERISGDVRVQVVIDEKGRVIWAQVVSGPKLLEKEALKAVCQWRFSPSQLAGRYVRIDGVITFKFRLD